MKSAFLCAVVVVLSCGMALGLPQESVLWNFTAGNDGGYPYASLIFDAAGNLYGTTSVGGTSGWGTVFELTRQNGVWQENVLYSFTGGADGSEPTSSLTVDGSGNLYGITLYGGMTPCGSERRG